MKTMKKNRYSTFHKIWHTNQSTTLTVYTQHSYQYISKCAYRTLTQHRARRGNSQLHLQFLTSFQSHKVTTKYRIILLDCTFEQEDHYDLSISYDLWPRDEAIFYISGKLNKHSTSGTQNPYVSVQWKCNTDLPRWMHWSSRARCLAPSNILFYHRLLSVGLHRGSRISMPSMNCQLGLSQLLLQLRWDR